MMLGIRQKPYRWNAQLFPCTCAKDRARDQNTTESDNSMADEKAGEDQCCNNKEPYDGRHSVNSFLPKLGIGERSHD